MMVLLAIPCKAGTLQVLEEGVVEVRASNRRVWTIPSPSITRVTSHRGVNLLTLLVYTRHGIYQAEMITPKDITTFCTCFPHLTPRKKRHRMMKEQDISFLQKRF